MLAETEHLVTVPNAVPLEPATDKKLTAKRNSMICLLVVGTAIVLAFCVIVYSQNQGLVVLQNSVFHSQKVLTALEKTLSAVKDAETGQRGFLLTGDNNYLAPYNTAQITLGQNLQELSELIADDPAQRDLARELPLAINDKLSELKQTIAVYRSAGQREAIAIVKSDKYWD